MIIRIVPILAALILSVLSLPTMSEEVKIATFNTKFLTKEKVHVRFGFPLAFKKKADKEMWEASGFRDNKFAEAVAIVAPFIDRIDADILVLTEVGNVADVTKLNQKLETPYPFVEVCECTDRNTSQHLAILSRIELKDVVYALKGREGYLPELDDPETEKDTGLSKGFRVLVNLGRYEVAIYGIHLISETGGYASDAQRIAQASLVRRHYLKDIELGRSVIVAGDFNDKRGHPALRRIRGFDDIGPDLIQTGLSKYFPKSSVGERWTYEFNGERNQIDHILISSDLRNNIKRRSALIIRAPEDVSDHSPLIITLKTD